jgi:hypothetical protein
MHLGLVGRNAHSGRPGVLCGRTVSAQTAVAGQLLDRGRWQRDGQRLADLLALAVLSGAILVAMLKYRLYDIDRILNRTLVYGLLTSLLIGVYAGLVFLLGRLLDPATGDSALAVAASTLAVAALFQPARRRVQAVVDRRFNRRKYNAAKTIEGFSARLRDQVDLDTLATELLAVTDKTMQPTTVPLWLRPPDEASKAHAPGWDY